MRLRRRKEAEVEAIVLDMNAGEPFVVTRSADGSLDPPADESWDDFTMLRWWAGVVTCDTGLAVKVTRAGRGFYGIGVRASGVSMVTSRHGYRETHAYLCGMNAGVDMLRRSERVVAGAEADDPGLADRGPATT